MSGMSVNQFQDFFCLVMLCEDVLLCNIMFCYVLLCYDATYRVFLGAFCWLSSVPTIYNYYLPVQPILSQDVVICKINVFTFWSGFHYQVNMRKIQCTYLRIDLYRYIQIDRRCKISTIGRFKTVDSDFYLCGDLKNLISYT